MILIELMQLCGKISFANYLAFEQNRVRRRLCKWLKVCWLNRPIYVDSSTTDARLLDHELIRVDAPCSIGGEERQPFLITT